ncbi:MAG: hypothetical protein P4M09_08205 [Devosia sp.]|nr:hypothetical protein [Devosia sp.]
MQLGLELARLTAGLDKLYRDVPRTGSFLDREGLIPVAVAQVEPYALKDYGEARDRLEAFQGRIPDAAESPLRQAYLLEMVDSLLALLDTFEGRQISYAERLRRQMRVDTQTVGAEVLDGYRQTIRENLDELGYRGGSLGEDVARFEKDTIIPADRVLDSMAEYTREARRRTSEMMYLLNDEWIEPVRLDDVPFTAYCDFPERKMRLNLAFPFTRSSIKHLACHEAFPGHLVHLALRQRYVAEGKMPLDGAQVVTSSASSALFEGIADNGWFFLDWINTPEDVVGMTLERLRAALRCNAAWMLHGEGRTAEEVAALIAEAGYQDVATAASRIAFLRHGLRAPFVYAYWCGDTSTHAVWEKVPKERRKEFWAYLYGNMHTPSTLRDFWPAS